MGYYIGIDLGTSSVKLLMMDEEGTLIASVSKEYPLLFPQDGWAEQRPEDWWEAVKAGLRELTAGCDASQIRGVSFGGQMHGLVMLDEHDRVVRPAILWNDGRSQKQCEYLNNVIGREKLSALTANIAFAGFTAPKILWVRENEPENFAAARKIMLPKDYIAYRMTGVFSTDYSDASGMLLLDVKNKRWSQEMLELCGIDKSMLPKLYESYEITGTVRSEVARETGLPEGVKVAAGAGDNAAAAIGTGTVENGQCNISLGTSGTVFIAQDTFSVDPQNALHSFAHATGKYHLMGCILSAASCNRWWLEDVLGTKDYSFNERGVMSSSARLGENSVFFLPYLMGERSPHNDPDVRGMFIGMSLNTTRADMSLAVLEGVAFALRDCVEIARAQGIEITSANVCGGGARSQIWRRILANVLNMEITTLKKEEGPAFGAAILAAIGCGAFADVNEAVQRLMKRSDYEHTWEAMMKSPYYSRTRPQKEIVARYDERYRQFVKLYPAIKGLL